MLILGIHSGWHDVHAALFDNYTLLSAVQQERLTRVKGHGQCIPYEAIDECLDIAGTTSKEIDVVLLSRGLFPEHYFAHHSSIQRLAINYHRIRGKKRNRQMSTEMFKHCRLDAENMFRSRRFLNSLGCNNTATLEFYNHHEAHALSSIFFTDWAVGNEDSALLFSADGIGDGVSYSHRIVRNNEIEVHYGSDRAILEPWKINSVGFAYQYATQALGYLPNRHEGKLTGLAAWGEPVLTEQITSRFFVNNHGEIGTNFSSYSEMKSYLLELFERETPQNIAASIQSLTENIILKSVSQLARLSGARFLGLSGGVHANVKLNQHLIDNLPLEEAFVFPAMGDCGLGIGGALSYLLRRDGTKKWLEHRYRLEHLYFGNPYNNHIDKVLSNATGVQRVAGNWIDNAVNELANGKVVAIFSKAMEYGPRALGARSILASPTDARINDTLNKRLSRTEFMPFAPVISEDDSSDVFNITNVNKYSSRFMTTTCLTRESWKKRIPGVVHVDGTARPQIISRSPNPLYFDILQKFKVLTGIPVLINTSFNVHEEPIINTPNECLKALLDKRVDAVVTERGYYVLSGD